MLLVLSVVVICGFLLFSGNMPSLKRGAGKRWFMICAVFAVATCLAVVLDQGSVTVKLLGCGAIAFFVIAAMVETAPPFR